MTWIKDALLFFRLFHNTSGILHLSISGVPTQTSSSPGYILKAPQILHPSGDVKLHRNNLELQNEHA